ncbi:hypothetical protein [Bacillus sp. V5-8f]|nr:hypothetical protein [Bacillus sp. V5-8f]
MKQNKNVSTDSHGGEKEMKSAVPGIDKQPASESNRSNEQWKGSASERI